MIEFIAGPHVWTRITAAAKKNRRPAYVAVAYFGKGASKMLPLPKGSRLVVDASEHAVKSGQTHPADLKRLVTKRVHVYTLENLHAKVFVFGSTAFIGSANVSRNSSEALIEALVATTDRGAVRAARGLVQGHCLQDLGPKELDRLQKVYRPPRGRTGAASRLGTRRRIRSVFLAQLESNRSPKELDEAEASARRSARGRMAHPRTHVLDTIWSDSGWPFGHGDVVVQILETGGGTTLVSPPANVVGLKACPYRKKTCTFVYLERPAGRRVETKRLARRIGPGARKALSRRGRAGVGFAERLLAALGDQGMRED